MIDLRKGDCLELMKDLPDKSIDAIIADLPYGTTACKWDSIIPFEPLWEQYERIIKDNGAIVLFGNEPFSSHLRMSNIKKYRYDWKWDKVRGSNFATVNRRPFNSFEDIMVFYKKQPTYNPQFWQGKPYEQKQGYVGESKQTGLSRKEVVTKSDGRRYPLSIIRFSKENGLHPTQKPVALLEYLIKTYTNEGELVLDNTMGSGTTGVACVNTNRNFIGMELDDKYFEIAEKRINDTIKDKQCNLF
jgi:DNA modification methylase